MYLIEKNLNKLRNGQNTFFLDPKEFLQIKGKLKKDEYSVYYPYKDSEKVILYVDEIPKVLLYEIKVKIPVRHQDILGAIYSLNISKELFGDILLIDGKYYIYILPIVQNYFEANFLKIKNSTVELEEIPIEMLTDYERKYESFEIIVSSNRIDTVISTICHVGRKNIEGMIQKKEILLNYDFLKETNYKLKEKDVFSIKKIGKFQYKGIIKHTKSDHLIVQIFKYV